MGVEVRMSKLIIFDCDGVLVDSEIIAHRIGVKKLAGLGYFITVKESIKLFTGLSDQKIQQHIFKNTGVNVDFGSSGIQKKISNASKKELVPLMSDVLQSSIFSNTKKCIASNSPKNRVLESLKITQQDRFFSKDHVFTSSQVKCGKPAPDLFLYAANQMGYHPKDCLVIEDSITGVEAAHAAKMKVIGFLGGSHAQFKWYKDILKNKNIPIVYDSAKLIAMIEGFKKIP